MTKVHCNRVEVVKTFGGKPIKVTQVDFHNEHGYVETFYLSDDGNIVVPDGELAPDEFMIARLNNAQKTRIFEP